MNGLDGAAFHCREPPPMAGGFGHEKHVADLTVADDPGPAYDGVIDEVYAVHPPMVSGDRAESAD